LHISAGDLQTWLRASISEAKFSGFFRLDLPAA
jgi:hypothetical protein